MSTRKHSAPTAVRFDTVLIAMDATDASAEVARAGSDLALRLGARTEFVHAVGAPGLSWLSEPTPQSVARGEDLVTQARERVVRLVNRANESSRGVAVDIQERVHVVAGSPAKVILERARATSADLIVLGPLRPRKAIDFGGTARTVLSRARCAVWTQPCAPMAVKRILVPFDFSEESLIAVASAIRLAQTFGARITVLHCMEPLLYGDDPLGSLSAAATFQELEHGRSSAFESAMARIDWNGVVHENAFSTGVAAERIVEQSATFDLVVMGTHGRTGISAAVLGSVAYSVLKRVSIPVLVLRDTSRTFLFD